MITFTTLKYLSFAHSAVYLALLTLWIGDGPDGPRAVLGWAHGIGWICMSLLCIWAVRKRIIPLWLGVMVAGVVLGNFTRAAGLPLVVAAFAWLALRRR